MNIAGAQADLVAALTAAGIRAVTDERDVNPPCVLIPPPAMTFRFGKGGWDAAWSLLAIVPDSGRDVAVVNLGDLVDQIQTALSGAVATASPASALGVDGAPPLPAYELTFTTRIGRNSA